MTRVPRCGICGSTHARSYEHPWDTPVFACVDCKARFVFPPPLPEDARARYSEEHASGKWEQRFRHQHDPEVLRRAHLLTRLAGRPGLLFDVGCGDGRFLRAASSADWTVTGCEIAESAAALVPDFPVVVGGLDAIADRPVLDAVTFWDVLEHVADPASWIRAAAARLKPGGLVAVTMPNVAGTSSRMLGRKWPYYDFDTFGHLFHLAPGHICRLLLAAGLDPVYQETLGSVDLRDLPSAHLGVEPPPILRAVLDRLSGVVAKGAVALRRGNTLLVVGRRRL